MRKQYYFRPSPRGLLAWDVDRLVLLSREFVEHVQLMDTADFTYSIILAADGCVMDGRHRLAKAMD